MAGPAGIEPTSRSSKHRILSIELRTQVFIIVPLRFPVKFWFPNQ